MTFLQDPLRGRDFRIPIDGTLTVRNAFLFPIQNETARRELLFGALFFIFPPLGWIVNMGYRMNLCAPSS